MCGELQSVARELCLTELCIRRLLVAYARVDCRVLCEGAVVWTIRWVLGVNRWNQGSCKSKGLKVVLSLPPLLM